MLPDDAFLRSMVGFVAGSQMDVMPWLYQVASNASLQLAGFPGQYEHLTCNFTSSVTAALTAGSNSDEWQIGNEVCGTVVFPAADGSK